MKKGILIIAGVWLLTNFVSWIFFGTLGAVISTYCCMGIVWFGRKILIRKLNI